MSQLSPSPRYRRAASNNPNECLPKSCIYFRNSSTIPTHNFGVTWILLGLFRKFKFDTWTINSMRSSPTHLALEPKHGHSLRERAWKLTWSQRATQAPGPRGARLIPDCGCCPCPSPSPPTEETASACWDLCQSRSPNNLKGKHYHGYCGASRAAVINWGYRLEFSVKLHKH